MTLEAILALMILLVPPHFQADGEEQARERYATIAESIAALSDDTDLTRYLLTIAKHESDFRRDIHSGDLRGDEGRSWGLFQILCGRDPDAEVPGDSGLRARHIVGTSKVQTANAVYAAITLLRPIIARCRAKPLCVFRTYGGVRGKGDRKTEERINARVATFERLKKAR